MLNSEKIKIISLWSKVVMTIMICFSVYFIEFTNKGLQCFPETKMDPRPKGLSFEEMIDESIEFYTSALKKYSDEKGFTVLDFFGIIGKLF